MVNILAQKKKKQVYLLIIFVILIIITVVLFLTDKKEKIVTAPSIIELPVRPVNIDWDFLQALQSLNFTEFSTIPNFEKQAGRDNPFLKGEIIEQVSFEDF
ncbi:MAG: hypothetical protein PHN37_00445 [Candidatus Pacebacteria bacterium]|nr:hypothetical protein [Candidatus Paceibacterota bacterium]